MRLEDKTAIVTGAASGIGRGTAERMAREGARVVAVDINEVGLEQTVESIRRDGWTATACVADVARDEQVRNMVQCAVDTYGGLHILHNNAYWHAPGSVCDLAEADWDRTLDVCLKAIYLGCRHAIPVMRES